MRLDETGVRSLFVWYPDTSMVGDGLGVPRTGHSWLEYGGDGMLGSVA